MLNENASLKEVIDTFELINSKLIDRGGARTVTPNTSNQVLSKGNYKGDITVLGDLNLIPENIKSGVSIFNVVGNLTGGNKKFASGTLRTSTLNSDLYSESGGRLDKFDDSSIYSKGFVATYSGLTFTPRIIILVQSGDAGTIYERACTVCVDNICIMSLASGSSGRKTYYPVSVRLGETNASLQWYVNSTGFQLPCASLASNYNWYAFE